jgi:hypothetical protein
VLVRLMCVDTEESQVPKGMSRHYKPITYGGKEADLWLKDHLGCAHDGRPSQRCLSAQLPVELSLQPH